MSSAGSASQLVAACAECLETTYPAIAGALPSSTVIRRFRAADGRLRVDYGNFTMLTIPATGERILMDHIGLMVRILAVGAPLALASFSPESLAAGAAFAAGLSPASVVVALGTAMVEGLELEGARHVFQVLDPLAPPPIYSWEVWNSTHFQMPMITTTIGTFGVRTCVCRCVPVTPPEALFQIPAGYRVTRERAGV